MLEAVTLVILHFTSLYSNFISLLIPHSPKSKICRGSFLHLIQIEIRHYNNTNGCSYDSPCSQVFCAQQSTAHKDWVRCCSSLQTIRESERGGLADSPHCDTQCTKSVTDNIITPKLKQQLLATLYQAHNGGRVCSPKGMEHYHTFWQAGLQAERLPGRLPSFVSSAF